MAMLTWTAPWLMMSECVFVACVRELYCIYSPEPPCASKYQYFIKSRAR